MSEKRPIVFLSTTRSRRFASTIMRASQLPALLASQLEERAISAVEDDSATPQNAIVFLPKNIFQERNEALLERLSSAGNVIVGDLLDQKPNPYYARYCDIVVVATKAGVDAAQAEMPDIPAFQITHHVDPRIAAGNSAKALTIGYFGVLQNTVVSEPLQEHVTYTPVAVTKQDKLGAKDWAWLDDINGFNCHFAVRRARHFDGLKPFTKGFTAARCEANIIIQETEPDVVEYLGDDYPYLLRAPFTEADILSLIERMREEYNGTEWHRGLERMRSVADRCSPAHIANEFKDVLRCADAA